MTPPDPFSPAGSEPAASQHPVDPPSERTGSAERGADDDPDRVVATASEAATIDLADRVIDVTDRTIDVTDRAVGRPDGTIDLTEVPGLDPSRDEEADLAAAARQRALGVRLRRIRAQQGLSLAQVEQRSEGRWKAVVVGAYERGDRAVTVERLAALAAFYDVPVSHLLPSSSPVPADDGDVGVLLDLTRLAVHDDRADALGAIARFARRMQLQRGDHAGRVITLRDTDVRTIALAAGIEPTDLRQDLHTAGVCDG